MHPTTVSQEFALIAVIALSISVAINLFRVLFPARRRKNRQRIDAVLSIVGRAVDAVLNVIRAAIPRKREKRVVGIPNLS